MAQTYTFSPITATDHAGLVWVASILSLMFSVLTLLTRFQLRLRSLGKDDWILAAATIVGLGQYVAVFVGLANGVGKSSTLLTEAQAATLGQSVLASEVLFLISLALSKMSVVYFMKRLFTPDHQVAWTCCNVAAAITVIWGIGSPLGISVGCGSYHILYGTKRCPGKMLRWRFVISSDGILEVAYVALAIILVWSLKMKHYIKITIVCAFGSRLVCAVFAALHGAWISNYIRSDDPGLAIANVLVWQQVELGYALIATTIPTLKAFVRGYDKAMGWDSSYEKRTSRAGYNLGFHPVLAEPRPKDAPQICETGSEPLQLGPRIGQYRVGAFHDGSRSKPSRRLGSSESIDSEDPIIWRNISVSVQHERASRSNSHA